MSETQQPQGTQPSEDDVISILLQQHTRVRELFREVREAEGTRRRQLFDELRAMLAVHETGEEMILRPVSKEVAGAATADARNHEEKEANRFLAMLEKMDVSTPEFETRFADFERRVLDHAEQEEKLEFPAVRAARSEEQLRNMGKRLRLLQRFAPTHPHPATAGSPAAQWVVGPFASLLDRVRDAVAAR